MTLRQMGMRVFVWLFPSRDKLSDEMVTALATEMRRQCYLHEISALTDIKGEAFSSDSTGQEFVTVEAIEKRIEFSRLKLSAIKQPSARG